MKEWCHIHEGIIMTVTLVNDSCLTHAYKAYLTCFKKIGVRRENIGRGCCAIFLWFESCTRSLSLSPPLPHLRLAHFAPTFFGTHQLEGKPYMVCTHPPPSPHKSKQISSHKSFLLTVFLFFLLPPPRPPSSGLRTCAISLCIYVYHNKSSKSKTTYQIQDIYAYMYTCKYVYL